MDDLGAAVVVFGVLGYLFLRHGLHRTSFRWDALEWQQNVFESTAVGLAILAVGRLAEPLLFVLAVAWDPAGITLAYLGELLPFPFADALVAGTAVGGLALVIGNGIWPKDKALEAAVRHHGGSLRILLHDANRTNRAVMLTLSNRKVYVGWVFVPPPLKSPSHVVVFPTLSGYRGSDSLAVNWTTNYSPAYQDLIDRDEAGEELQTRLQHFQLVIPMDTVTSATYFDFEMYDRHFAGDGATRRDQ